MGPFGKQRIGWKIPGPAIGTFNRMGGVRGSFQRCWKKVRGPCRSSYWNTLWNCTNSEMGGRSRHVDLEEG
jgi:hypothetical protein